MTVYHIGTLPYPKPTYKQKLTRQTQPVLFRLKQGVTSASLSAWRNTSQSMVGKVPGLLSVNANSPLPISVPRAKGFDYGLVAMLESPEHVKAYATHPAHLE